MMHFCCGRRVKVAYYSCEKTYVIDPRQGLKSQLAFTYSKLTVETLEQGVKYVLKLTIKIPE